MQIVLAFALGMIAACILMGMFISFLMLKQWNDKDKH